MLAFFDWIHEEISKERKQGKRLKGIILKGQGSVAKRGLVKRLHAHKHKQTSSKKKCCCVFTSSPHPSQAGNLVRVFPLVVVIILSLLFLPWQTTTLSSKEKKTRVGRKSQNCQRHLNLFRRLREKKEASPVPFRHSTTAASVIRNSISDLYKKWQNDCGNEWMQLLARVVMECDESSRKKRFFV